MTTDIDIAVSNSQYEPLEAILVERDYQDEKWGPVHSSGGHTLSGWIIIIEAELAEAKEAIIKGGRGRDSLRSELVQVAACVLAALEQHGIQDDHDRRQV